jgi:hypothetical protein
VSARVVGDLSEAELVELMRTVVREELTAILRELSLEGGQPERGDAVAATRSTVAAPGPAVLLSAGQAAALLGISVAALRKRVQRSQLPRGSVVQTGRSYQFRRDRLLPP